MESGIVYDFFYSHNYFFILVKCSLALSDTMQL